MSYSQSLTFQISTAHYVKLSTKKNFSQLTIKLYIIWKSSTSSLRTSLHLKSKSFTLQSKWHFVNVTMDGHAWTDSHVWDKKWHQLLWNDWAPKCNKSKYLFALHFTNGKDSRLEILQERHGPFLCMTNLPWLLMTWLHIESHGISSYVIDLVCWFSKNIPASNTRMEEIHNIDGLVQDCSISNALAMEMRQSGTKPLLCF